MTARSSYAWHRRVPWVAVGGAALLLVIGVLVARSFGVGENAGHYTGPGSGKGDHPTEGTPITRTIAVAPIASHGMRRCHG